MVLFVNWHSGAVVSTVASQQEVSWVRLWGLPVWFGCSLYTPTVKRHAVSDVRLTGDSNLPIDGIMVVCLSVLACDKLMTCPGCTLPLTPWYLG